MQSDIVVRYLTTYCSTAVCKTCRLMPCHGTRPRLRLKIKRKRKKEKEKRPLRNVSNCMDFIVSNPQYFSKITSHCSTACRVIPSTISAHLTWSHKQGILEIFCEKSRGPPTYQNGLMHDPSQITTQKHLTLPPPPPRQNNRR